MSFTRACVVSLCSSPQPQVTIDLLCPWWLILSVLEFHLNSIGWDILMCWAAFFFSLTCFDMRAVVFINSSFLLNWWVVFLLQPYTEHCTSVGRSVYLLMDIWVISSVETLWIKLPWTFVNRSLCGLVFLFHFVVISSLPPSSFPPSLPLSFCSFCVFWDRVSLLSS